MKKTYLNPTLLVINAKPSCILAGSRSYNPSDAAAADNATKNGGWNARKGSFSGWNEEE